MIGRSIFGSPMKDKNRPQPIGRQPSTYNLRIVVALMMQVKRVELPLGSLVLLWGAHWDLL